MKTHWQVQDVQDQFNQIVNQAKQDGPQTIMSNGEPAVIVMSFEAYQKLTNSENKLSEFFRESPLYGLDLDFERSKGLQREIDL